MVVGCIRWKCGIFEEELPDFRIDGLRDFGFQIRQSENSAILQLELSPDGVCRNTRSLAALGISPAGSDARKAAQLAEKNSTLYTWGFPENVQTSSPREIHWAGRVHG